MAPPSEGACKQTLRYIFASGDTVQPERVARIKSAQEKYNGKRVVVDGRLQGAVRYIRACSVGERVGRGGSGPIVACIDWDDGSHSTHTVSQLKVLEEEARDPGVS